MADIVQCGDWYFTSRPVRRGQGVMAWCAKTPELGNSPLDPPFPLDVYFEFADTAEEAVLKLKRQVLT